MAVTARETERIVLADCASKAPEIPWEVTDKLGDATRGAIGVNDARAATDPESCVDGGLAVVDKSNGSLTYLGGMEAGLALENFTHVPRP